MEAIRKHIAAKPKEFLKLIRETEKATGIPITADLYKRPKETDDPALAPFYAWKGNISCTVTEEVNPQMFGPELGKRVCSLIEKLIPLYEFFNQFCV